MSSCCKLHAARLLRPRRLISFGYSRRVTCMPPADKKSANGFTPYQTFVVAALAFLQFAVILDFMIVAPLGALVMPALSMSPREFGFIVSAYAFSAGASGLLVAGFADRYDRKKLLLFFYTGFVLGTLWCGLANSFHALLAARIVTGIFGGVIGGMVMAIATDLFEPEPAWPRDGLHPDVVRREPDPGTARGHLPVQPLGLARAVPGDGGVRHRRRPGGRVEAATRGGASRGAAGTQPVDAPVRHGARAAPLERVPHHDAARDRRLHADAVRQRLRREQPGHRASRACRRSTSSPASSRSSSGRWWAGSPTGRASTPCSSGAASCPS